MPLGVLVVVVAGVPEPSEETGAPPEEVVPKGAEETPVFAAPVPALVPGFAAPVPALVPGFAVLFPAFVPGLGVAEGAP